MSSITHSASPVARPARTRHAAGRTVSSRAARRRRAFTLVELLVVIGIIAVLIGVLLPALNKARQTASKVACASNLHNLGILMTMYTNQYKGSFPMSRGANDSQGNEMTWGALLSALMQYGTGTASSVSSLDSTTAKGRGIFVCPDAISFAPIEPNDYAAHPLLMPNMVLNYPTTGAYAGTALSGKQRRPYKVQRIRNASEIVLMFDSVQSLVATGNTGVGAASADGFALDGQRIAVISTAPATYLQQPWSVAQGFDLSQSIDGGINKDSKDGSTADMIWGNIRWRHLDNKAANFLFVDGHVESAAYTSRYNTGLSRKNVCVPPPQ